ncbi:MAG: glycosyltransferase [Pseudomonadota bacterium]
MNILIVSQIYYPQKEGGAERVARHTADMLHRHGHRVNILALCHKTQGPPADITANIPVYRLPYTQDVLPGTGPMNMPPLQKLRWHMHNAYGGVKAGPMGQLLDQIRPDVIYEHNSRLLHPRLARAARARGIPTVVHLHDYGWICPRNSMIRKGRNCATPCMDCTGLTRAWRQNIQPRSVIAVSDFVKARYQQAGVFPDAQWHVLRNASPLNPKGPPARGGPRRFGFIGALAPDKGITDVLQAFAALNAPQSELVVAGSGAAAYTKGLHSLCQDLGITRQVHWLGHVPQDAFYTQVECVVVPSLWHEPQSLVLGESLSRGIPLIASDRGGNTEVITSANAGLLFEPNRPGDLTGALRQMMQGDMPPLALDSRGVLPTPAEFEDRLVQIITKGVA